MNATAPMCKEGPCRICREVAEVDEEINKALAKRCDLLSEQNRVHGSLVHRLPVELRNYIFELLLPSRHEWGEIDTRDKFIMPCYLASICRSWRDIAWSNPFLWSAMNMTVGKRGPTFDSSSRIHFVHKWIQRSRTLPLSLHIVAPREEGVEELKCLIDAISRCRCLSLFLPSPQLLRAFLHSNSQSYYLLKKLRILCEQGDVNQPVPLLNTTASPKKIVIRGLSFQSLQISWSNLSHATVQAFGLEDVMQLFQHAPQMTRCRIVTPGGAQNFSMPPIIHQRLKILTLECDRAGSGVPEMIVLLGSLTLPCLQEFRTNEMRFLSPPCLPALVNRSSCPLTWIALYHISEIPHDLRPFPAVTGLVLGTNHSVVPRATDLFFSKDIFPDLFYFFPDLCYLRLRLPHFRLLWDMGVISMLLYGRTDVPNERKLHKIFVVDPEEVPNFPALWNSDFGRELKAMNTILTEHGFVISSPDKGD